MHVINELWQHGHTKTSEIEQTIAQSALEIVKKKGDSITLPVIAQGNMVSRLTKRLKEKIDDLTDQLIKNKQLDKSPQSKLAIQDVIILMARLYEQHEVLRENRLGGAPFHEQVAALVCENNLESLIAQYTQFQEGLPVITAILDSKMMRKLQTKASQGSWDKTYLPWKNCEEYYALKPVRKMLKKANVVRNHETITWARILLFKAMCEGINVNDLESLRCAEKFTSSYPEEIQKIAREYPTYFVHPAIAAACLKKNEDAKLLAWVQEQLVG